MTTSRRRRPTVTTCVALGALAAELIALRTGRPHETLCPDIRRAYRTDTRAGQVALTASWVALSAWFLPHILQSPEARP